MRCVRCVCDVAFAMCAVGATWRGDSSSGIAIDRFYPTRARARGLFVAVNRALGRAVDRASERVVVMGTVSSAVSMSRTRWVMDD